MRSEEYILSLQERITKLIKLTKNVYERITNTTTFSSYEYDQQTDEFEALITRILFYKKQLFRLVNAEEELEQQTTREEEIKIKHQRLLNDQAMFKEQISIIDKAIQDIGPNRKLTKVLLNLERERFHNQTSLDKINNELRIYENNPDLTDGEIDIYINGNEGDISFQGIIFLHNTPLEVGVIEYRGPCDAKWLGDIGYTINEEHRGHNYALKALELISQVILSKGIDKVTITTQKNNVASVKTIEKFGGVLTEIIYGDVLSFTCELKPVLENNKKVF